MSTNSSEFPFLSLKDVTALLIKSYSLHEGRFELSIELKIAVGTMGPTPDETLPGGMIGVSGMTLAKVTDDNFHPNVVDAAIVNPAKKPRKPAVRAAK